MANYTVINPGKPHLGVSFNFPPTQNRKYIDRNYIKEMKWKTSVLLNRRIYVGNVKLTDVDGKEQVLTDSIFKTKSNQFDTFTMDRRIDVAVGDGEEIIRLAAYADRLFQFKQNTLHIINVSGASEYLEATHKFKGVEHHNNVCETDYGIAWCNTHGVYFYDGQQVQELLIKQAVRRINSTTWSNFFNSETMIGYVPKEKQLVLFKNATDSGNIMVYDMVSKAWTKGTNRVAATEKTNLINSWDGQLLYGSETTNGYTGGTAKLTITPFNVDPGTKDINGFKLETKELNFGTQAQKKVTKVRITYKGANGVNTNLLPKYAVDGGGFDNNFKDEDGNVVTGTGTPATRKLVGDTNWKEVTLYTDSSSANNIRSFAIQLTVGPDGDVESDVEINDITIIYRTKSVK